MAVSGNTCVICGSKRSGFINGYEKCHDCGHEFLSRPRGSRHIVNEILSVQSIGKQTCLDRFKTRVLQRCSRIHHFLLDVGSASGRFLYQNKEMFERHAGIEITPECIEFSRQKLKLNIFPDTYQARGPVSVVTFWHSLEHLPVHILKQVLSFLENHLESDGRVIVSVPNADSLQSRWFGRNYAYFDIDAHYHQFTVESLDLIMKQYGFKKEKSFFSIAYSLFGYLQGLLNYFNKIHNYYYYRKKREISFYRNKTFELSIDIYNIFLINLLILPATLLCLIDFSDKKLGGVYTSCYQKKK